MEPTTETPGSATRQRVLALVVGMVLFLIASNVLAIVGLDRVPINRSNWLVREKWRLVDRSSADTLVLGDSSCSQAVRPDVLDPAWGAHSLNLCTVGNMLALGDVWLLSEYIRQHGKPKKVVIIHVYDAWARTADHALAQLLGKIERPWGFWNDLTPPLDLDASMQEDLAISRWLPIVGENSSLLRLLEIPFLGRPPVFRLERPSGFMKVTEAKPARVVKDSDNHLADLRMQAITGAPIVSAINRRALVRLGELAEREQLDIVIAPAPMFTGLWEHPEAQQRLHDVMTQVRDLAHSPHVRVIDAPPPTFAAEDMENVDHIVGEATRRYTEWLAQVAR